ncbi:hypothetical protein BD410DRAFT_769812 [Rickenella mellea]|uniref:Uncharacterized protein n=1 Tax=Rickenella mellea TaxID=50990 RepID=A0A4Y7Q7K0_9AGAM|nr:hypothetical protein BD410DRAFT_769812 [Rickenella mellea]
MSHPSPNPDFSHIPPQKLVHGVKTEQDILDYEPGEVVDIALQALQNDNIKLVEWRALLYRRMNVPVHPLIVTHPHQNYSYLVPDDCLESASIILASLGLPPSPPSRLALKSTGDFSAQGRFHRITQTTLISGVQHLILYPLSFSTLSFLETTLEFPYHVETLHRCTSIYVPRIPAVYASIIRMMLKYPQYCSTRTRLESDLSELVGYNLQGLECGYVDPEDDKLWQAMHIEQRISAAVCLVLQWSCDQAWREGEGWIGDALGAVIQGNVDIGDLPHKSSS